MDRNQHGDGEPQQTDLTTEEQDLQLEEAKKAAAGANPLRMVECLHKSRALAGLVRRLQSKWPGIASSEIDMAVAKAVDAAYEFIRTGKKVFQLVAFLWKVADRRAFDYHRSAVREIPTDPTILESVADPNSAAPGADDEERAEDERQKKVERAVKIARSLLPRLGQENVQRVMSLVIDAAEQGLVDLPNAHIADVLGLSLDTVKKSKSRGLQRLKRLAREEGLLDEATLTEINNMGEEPADQDDEA
jgi:DNA-directed RNA polymerase specialized sigma24 family protein